MKRTSPPLAQFVGSIPSPATSAILVSALVLVFLSGCTFPGSSRDEPPEVGQVMPAANGQQPTAQPTPFTLSEPSPTPSAIPPPTGTSVVPPTPHIANSALVESIDGLLATEAGVYGVVVLDADGGYQYAKNADVPFVAASLYKLVLLTEIYAMVEDGQIGLDDSLPLKAGYFESEFDEEDGYYVPGDAGGETTVEQALYGAGAYSSNVAAKALLDLTSLANLKTRAESLGMHDTFFNVTPAELADWPDRYISAGNPDAQLGVAFVETQAQYGPVNITTPNDVARFWLGLLNGEIVSLEASASMLEILREQAVTDRIPWLLPEDMATANKTGNLYHVVHDTGLIFDPDGTLVLAVLSEGEPDDDHGKQVIQRIALVSTGETVVPPFTETAISTPVGEE
ncbi:hypothetical protein BH23CHL4_BH23CHL4_16790 [soil metagenome]